MIPAYTAIAIATVSLPIPFHLPASFRASYSLGVPAPSLDLPEVERLKIVIPAVQRAFDGTLPSFIKQPTPVLEVIIPEHEPSAMKPPGRRVPAPAPAMID